MRFNIRAQAGKAASSNRLQLTFSHFRQPFVRLHPHWFQALLGSEKNPNCRKYPELRGNRGLFRPRKPSFGYPFLPSCFPYKTGLSILHDVKEQHRLPHLGSDQIAWYVLLVPITNVFIISQDPPESTVWRQNRADRASAF